MGRGDCGVGIAAFITVTPVRPRGQIHWAFSAPLAATQGQKAQAEAGFDPLRALQVLPNRTGNARISWT